MTIRFFVAESIPDYNVYDPNPSEPNDYVWYGNEVIKLGKNTIGYWAKKYPGTKYQSVTLPWISGGESGSGILTYPVRKWTCVFDPILDLAEFRYVSGDFHSEEEGTLLDVHTEGSDASLPIAAKLYSKEGGGGGQVTRAYYMFTLKENSQNSNLFNALGKGSSEYNNLIDNGYFSIEKIDSGITMTSDFDHETNCKETIKEAIEVVMNTINKLTEQLGYTNLSQEGPLNISRNGDFTLMNGMQSTFRRVLDSSLNHRMTPVIAKNILNSVVEYYNVTNEVVIGYIFPENKYFKVVSESAEGSSYVTNYFLDLTDVASGEELCNETTKLIEQYGEVKDTTGNDTIGRYTNIPLEVEEYSRAFLLLDSLSGVMGSTDTISDGAIGNVYEISLKRDIEEVDGDEGSWYESKFTICYKAIPKFGAFLERGMYTMPNNYGHVSNNAGGWTRNATFERLKKGFKVTT